MSFIFIGTTGDQAGHSLLTWTMARWLAEKGLSVGFIKPLGSRPIYIQGLWTDQDALLFKRVLRLSEPLDRLCPFPRPEEAWGEKDRDEMIGEIRSLVKEISTGKDILLIMGSRHIFFDDPRWGVSDIHLELDLEADFVLVDRYGSTQASIYSILSVGSLIKDRLKGVVLNRVPTERLGMIKGQMIPLLVSKGIPFMSVIPEDPFLSYRTLGAIRDLVDGDFLWGEEDLNRSVGGMTVGSQDLKGGLVLLRRVYNKIIFLEPASLEGGVQEDSFPRPIAGVLLTGGRRPAPQVLEAIRKAHVPLILTREDTFAALKRLEQPAPGLTPDDEAKVLRFTELMNEDGALEILIGSLGLQPKIPDLEAFKRNRPS